MPSTGPIVYGEFEVGWLVLPRAQAAYWVAVKDAIASGNWDNVREAVGGETYEQWFEYSDWQPAPGETFDDPDVIPGYADGDFPPMPGALMLEWLPDEIAERFGEVVTTTFNGDRLDIYDDADPQQIVSELQALGYVVERDDYLIGSLENR